jgi:hypothetical protein
MRAGLPRAEISPKHRRSLRRGSGGRQKQKINGKQNYCRERRAFASRAAIGIDRRPHIFPEDASAWKRFGDGSVNAGFILTQNAGQK